MTGLMVTRELILKVNVKIIRKLSGAVNEFAISKDGETRRLAR